MLKVTYRDMEERIRLMDSYAHGSSVGVRGPREYAVVSYNTPIAAARLTDSGEWEYRMTSRKYSATTSRLQNIIRRAWGHKSNFAELDAATWEHYNS